MKVIGIRIEKYVGKKVEQNDYNFTYHDKVFKRHVICGIDDNDKKVEIMLFHTEGSCGSGYTTAQWGNKEVSVVDNFDSFTFFAKEDIIISDEKDVYSENYEDDDYSYSDEDFSELDYEPNYTGGIVNNVFCISVCGGDGYYPCGGYQVNMNVFLK